MPRVAGIDGCRKGWVVVVRESGTGAPTVAVQSSLEAVLDDPDLAVVAIDIPIGLLDAACPGGRECERKARKYLAGRSSSVFSTPVRATLDAGGHAEASERNRRSSVHGLGISAQCWGITKKIAEVDRLMTPERQARVHEVHPEVSFTAMNHGRALNHGKKSREGRAEREALLSREWRIDLSHLVATRLAGAKPDDLLDAMAAAWTAERVQRGTARRFPDSPPTDARGLRMEIVA